MKEYKKSLSILLAFSVLLTIFLPLGIVGTVLGAVNELWVVFGLGIGMTVVGFYGSPLIWISYGEKKKVGIVLKLIECENFYSVESIATQLTQDYSWVEKAINKLIEKGYLKGYIYKDGKLSINNNVKQVKTSGTKCPNCGGRIVSKDSKMECEYCGTIFNN